MKIKQLMNKFKEEFSLSEDCECEINQDDGGKTLDVLVPQAEAKEVRARLPRRWKKLRVLVMFKPKSEFAEDEWEI